MATFFINSVIFGGGGGPAPAEEFSIYDHSVSYNPTTPVVDDDPMTVGLILQSDVVGQMNSVVFWKPATDLATSRSIGVYNSATSALIGTGTSSSEATGVAQWVEIPLDAPVLMHPTVSYIAAVQAPNGFVSVKAGEYAAITEKRSGSFFAGGEDATVGNGRFGYNAALVFPGTNSSYNAYGVDAVMTEGSTFASAANTGYSGALTDYAGTAQPADSTVLENYRFTYLIQPGNNCEFRNCLFESNEQIAIDADGKTIIVEDCTFRMVTENADSNCAILGSGTFRNLDISMYVDGIKVQNLASTVDNCYIHDLGAPFDAHNDGISMLDGGGPVTIKNCTILSRDTSDIFIASLPINGVTIEHNFLGGNPGVNIYVHDGATNVVIRNNVIDQSAVIVDLFESDAPTFLNNLDSVTDAILSL